MNHPSCEGAKASMEPNRIETQAPEAPACTKLERRRRIEELSEAKRLREELKEFDYI